MPAEPDVQKTLSPGIDVHGVRLDVYYDDGTQMFDLEMHTGKDGKSRYLPKRTRYTHSAIDATALKHSEPYSKLRPCYVLYLCTFDPFGKGRYLYTVRNQVVEDRSIGYNDEAYTLYFNAKGTTGRVSKTVKEILRYIKDTKTFEVEETKIELIKQIDTAVKFNQQKPEWRLEYDMLSLPIQDAMILGEERGEIRGDRQGDNRRQRLVAIKLLSRNRPITEVAEDTELTLEEVLEIQQEQQMQGAESPK